MVPDYANLHSAVVRLALYSYCRYYTKKHTGDTQWGSLLPGSLIINKTSIFDPELNIRGDRSKGEKVNDRRCSLGALASTP